jgi:hypothetical protein
MLTLDQIENWEGLFATADKIVERANRGIPSDRWMTSEKEMQMFILAYEQMTHICSQLIEDCEELQEYVEELLG